MAFDTTHQPCLASELDAANGLPRPTMESGNILVVVDTVNFDKYIYHAGKWWGPMPNA